MDEGEIFVLFCFAVYGVPIVVVTFFDCSTRKVVLCVSLYFVGKVP